MAATYSYFYTVDTFINWSDLLINDTNMTQMEVTGYDPISYPNYICVHAESETTPGIKYAVQKGTQLKWRVRFYCRKVDSGVTTTYLLGNDAVKNVHVSLGAYNGKVANATPGVSTVGRSTSLTVSNSTGGNVFTFWTSVTQSSFTMSPPFTITADVSVGNLSSTQRDLYGGDTNTSNQTFTLKGANAAITVYAAKTTPPVPQAFLDALNELANAGGSIGTGHIPYTYDKCNDRWYGLSITGLTTTSPGKYTYKFRVVTAKANGTGISKGPIIPEAALSGSTAGVSKDGSKLKADRAELQKIILANCFDMANNGNGNGKDKGNVKPPPPAKPLGSGDLRYNPPTHRYSRDISYAERMRTNLEGTALVASIDQAIDELNLFATGERGRIIQDKSGAAQLNVNPDNLRLPEGLQGSKIWGFRFMYNPDGFAYSTSSNNSIDWTLGSKDPATVLSGNQTVTFELYINRIPDMTYLRDLKYGINKNVNIDQTQAYGRELDTTEIEGILARGTEYDIEFLYRVLNGDPLKNPLLFNNSGYNGITSDFGYTTAVPCWLYLNDNLRYYGSVGSFGVTHRIFTPEMIPMLSIVSITFNRYPALWNDTSVVGKDQKAVNAAIAAKIAGTP